MYFFDLADYYNRDFYSINMENGAQTWYNYGVAPLNVGCSGGGPGFFMEEYFATYRATRDAFLKALNEYYIAVDLLPTAVDEGYISEPLIDSGCNPDFKAEYVNVQYKIVEWVKSSIELSRTYRLCRYYYDYGKALNWQNIPSTDLIFQYDVLDPAQAWGGTYEDYKDYFLNTWDGGGSFRTGTEITSWSINNPYTNSPSAITFTANYGTSFEIADLTEKVNNYDTKMKDVMCSAKNMITLFQGGFTDAFDENGNFDGNLYKDYILF